MNELTKTTEQKLFNALHSGNIASAVPKKKEIFVLDEKISQWENIDAIDTIISGLRKGDELFLRREEDNEKNNCIIGVYDRLGQKVGYLRGGNYKIIARLMDAGKEFKAVLCPENEMDSLTNTTWVRYDEDNDYWESELHSVIKAFLTMNIYWVE